MFARGKLKVGCVYKRRHIDGLGSIDLHAK